MMEYKVGQVWVDPNDGEAFEILEILGPILLGKCIREASRNAGWFNHIGEQKQIPMTRAREFFPRLDESLNVANILSKYE
jgi:hypothetical protein